MYYYLNLDYFLIEIYTVYFKLNIGKYYSKIVKYIKRVEKSKISIKIYHLILRIHNTKKCF